MLVVFLHASTFLFSFWFLLKVQEYWITKMTQGAKSRYKSSSPQSISVFHNVFFTQCFDLFFFFVKLVILRTWVFLVFLSLVFLKNLQHYKKHFTASFQFHSSFSLSSLWTLSSSAKYYHLPTCTDWVNTQGEGNTLFEGLTFFVEFTLHNKYIINI